MTEQPHIEARKAPQLIRLYVHDGGMNRRALDPLATARIESAREGVRERNHRERIELPKCRMG